jgi:RNA polymerase sigma factor (sigma-70 family)
LLESSIVVPQSGEVGLAAEMAKHERLVRWVVRQSWLSGMPFEDAVHEGRIGLWRALRGYDPARGTALSTYAVPAIRHAVWDAVARHRAESAASPSPETAVPTHHVRLASPDQSLAVLEAVHAGLVQAELRRLLGQLPPRQQQIVVAHYGLAGQAPQTFAAIGQLLGVSRQRVQQLHLAALVWLAQPSRSLALRRLCGRHQRTDYQRTLARQHRVARRACSWARRVGSALIGRRGRK